MTAAPPELELTGLTAGYADRTVLQDISCRVAGGDFLGVIGPNGAGKTTLLRVLSGILPPSGGRVLFGGSDLRGMGPRDLSRQIAFVPQSLNVPVAFSVEEFVALGRTPYLPGWARMSDRDREVVRGVIGSVDLRGQEERPLDELSAGERQRALVALALAQEPEILLLDEPTAHLDIQHAWGLMELVHDLNRSRGMTVVLSAHDLNLAAEFCSKLLLLEKGRIAAFGSPSEVVDAAVLSRVYEHPLEVVALGQRRRTIVLPERKRAAPGT